MTLPQDERDRILQLVESGQIRAIEAGQLMDALEHEPPRINEAVRERILRIRTTTHDPRQARKSFMVSIPVSVLKISMRLARHLLPLDPAILDDVFRAIEVGTTGRIFDLQNLEQGERLEIFVE